MTPSDVEKAFETFGRKSIYWLSFSATIAPFLLSAASLMIWAFDKEREFIWLLPVLAASVILKECLVSWVFGKSVK